MPAHSLSFGIQTFALRKFSLEDIVRITLDLGLTHLEPGKLGIAGIGPENMQQGLESVAYCRQKGLRISCATIGFVEGGDVAAQRPSFEFARALQLDTIVTHPYLDMLGMLDELAQEYQIKIAFHNHGPKSPLDSMQEMESVVNSSSKWIGFCVDTGHHLRIPLDPLRVIREFYDRVHAIHLRDMDPDGPDPMATYGFKYREHVVGEGPLALEELLGMLMDRKFAHPVNLEYQPNADDPVPDLWRSVQNIRAALEGSQAGVK